MNIRLKQQFCFWAKFLPFFLSYGRHVFLRPHLLESQQKQSVSWVLLPLGPLEKRVQGGCSFYCRSPWCCRQGFHHFLLFTKDKDHGKLYATVLSLPGQLPRQPCRRSRVHCCSCSGWRLLEQIWIPVGASGVHHPKVILPEGAEWSSTMKLETQDGLLREPCPQYKDWLGLSRWAKLSIHFGGYIW